MTPSSHNNLLFDDFSLLAQAVGRKELIAASVNANCDCVGYTLPTDKHDANAAQSPASAGQAN